MGTSVRSRGKGWCLLSTVISCQAAGWEEAASVRARLRRRSSSILFSTWSLVAILLPRKVPMQVHMSGAASPISPMFCRLRMRSLTAWQCEVRAASLRHLDDECEEWAL